MRWQQIIGRGWTTVATAGSAFAAAAYTIHATTHLAGLGWIIPTIAAVALGASVGIVGSPLTGLAVVGVAEVLWRRAF